MGGLSADDGDTMSKRTHFWLRVAALAVIATLTWLPRGSQASSGKAPAGGSPVVQASVAAR